MQQIVVAEARRRLDGLLTHFGLEGVNWTKTGTPALNSRHLHLTYWSESWLGTAAIPPTQHVGGIGPTATAKLSPPPELAELNDPLVFVTLGTSFNEDPNFFVAAANAIDQMGAVPLIALGKALSTPGAGNLAQPPACQCKALRNDRSTVGSASCFGSHPPWWRRHNPCARHPRSATDCCAPCSRPATAGAWRCSNRGWISHGPQTGTAR